ncbi:MAG: hypothetical protein JO297_13370 [Nitrososphaeraceae archaeon]|nr:hypothetical protein [Nitrososphaeraceae archaeon]
MKKEVAVNDGSESGNGIVIVDKQQQQQQSNDSNNNKKPANEKAPQAY